MSVSKKLKRSHHPVKTPKVSPQSDEIKPSMPLNDPYQIVKKDLLSRGQQILHRMHSLQEMIILQEIIGPPKSKIGFSHGQEAFDDRS